MSLQFSLDTDFSRFYTERTGFYEEVVDKASALLKGNNYIKDLEDYCGIRQNSYNIILSPMFHTGGFGLRIMNENGEYDIFSIQGLIRWRMTFPCSDRTAASKIWYIMSSAIPS